MNKEEFIRKVADKAEITLKDARIVVEAVESVLIENIAVEDEIRPFNGVIFYKAHREPRKVRNPQTGEMMMSKEKYVPKVRFGTAIKAQFK